MNILFICKSTRTFHKRDDIIQTCRIEEAHGGPGGRGRARQDGTPTGQIAKETIDLYFQDTEKKGLACFLHNHEQQIVIQIGGLKNTFGRCLTTRLIS